LSDSDRVALARELEAIMESIAARHGRDDEAYRRLLRLRRGIMHPMAIRSPGFPIDGKQDLIGS
jgi:hypothetical protein